ncbi:MAG: hypothetical protein EKK55_08485 [Rhodocyclaceae bacterium]|nr:MAG: hypothetical protein EKK55_08485 [Rhodocyclaceae bacterium]
MSRPKKREVRCGRCFNWFPSPPRHGVLHLNSGQRYLNQPGAATFRCAVCREQWGGLEHLRAAMRSGASLTDLVRRHREDTRFLPPDDAPAHDATAHGA